MKKQTVTSDSISGESVVNYVNRVLNLGIDVHYRQVTVAMQEDGAGSKLPGNGSRGFSEVGAEEAGRRLAPAILPKGVGAYGESLLALSRWPLQG
jgi:hypothetical protein